MITDQAPERNKINSRVASLLINGAIKQKSHSVCETETYLVIV